MAKPAARALDVAEDSIVPGLCGEALVALLEGRASEQGYWQAVLKRTQWATTPAELGAMARAVFRQVVPGMPELSWELTDYRLVLFSDHAREWMADIERYHEFLSVFDSRFLSFEMRRTKRSPETFLHVAAALRARPEDCLLVDETTILMIRSYHQNCTLRRLRIPICPSWGYGCVGGTGWLPRIAEGLYPNLARTALPNVW